MFELMKCRQKVRSRQGRAYTTPKMSKPAMSCGIHCGHAISTPSSGAANITACSTTQAWKAM